MISFFKYVDLIATSATVESNFKDLKNRVFSATKIPLRANEYIKIHLASLDGKMNLVAEAVEIPNSVPGIMFKRVIKKITPLYQTKRISNPEISKAASANEQNKFNNIPKTTFCRRSS